MNLTPNLNLDQAWPELEDAALHGLAGDFVRAVEPHTEADPAALLFEFLAAAGNLVGPGPFVIADGAPHRCNIFVAVVGDTAKARKGTAQAHALRVVKAADPTWADRVVHGLGSGEGLVALLKPPAEEEEADQPDMRAHVAEAEFSRILEVAKRQGCTLSQVLRTAWDSGDLRVETRRDPLRVRGAHVSMAGHITRAELDRVFPEVELANGLANRFLWIAARRSKLLPRGGKAPQDMLDRLAAELRQVQDWAREPRELDFAAEAQKEWEVLYYELAEAAGDSLLDAVLARAEAQVLRLALVFSVLDRAEAIRPEHLRAAAAAWRYAEASARLVFGGRAGGGDSLAKKVLDLLGDHPEGLGRAEVAKRLGGHASAAELDRVRDRLLRQGKLTCARRETNGRPVEVWRRATLREAIRWLLSARQFSHLSAAADDLARWFSYRGQKGKPPLDLPAEIQSLTRLFNNNPTWLRAGIDQAIAAGWSRLIPEQTPRPKKSWIPLTDEEVEEFNRRKAAEQSS